MPTVYECIQKRLRSDAGKIGAAKQYGYTLGDPELERIRQHKPPGEHPEDM